MTPNPPPPNPLEDDICKFFLLNELNLDICFEFGCKNDLINYIQKNDLNTSIFLCKRQINVDMTKCLYNILKSLNQHIIEPIVSETELENEPSIFLPCEEFFYVQRQNKKKIIFWALSLMDGGNLINKLKGEKCLIMKKNQLAQYVYNKHEGDVYVEKTMDFLHRFFKKTLENTQFTKIDESYMNLIDDTVGIKTTIKNENELQNIFFIDTLDKTNVYLEIQNKCRTSKQEFDKFKQFLFLEKTINYLSNIRSKTKTQKIPVMTVIRYDLNKLHFSLQHLVYWLTTTNSVISI